MEQIHIIQRFNQDKFDSLFRILHFLLRKYNDMIPPLLDKKYINPDSNNSIWIYQIKENLYTIVNI